MIHADDNHALSFEVGYGTQNIRNQLGATSDEMIVYLTSLDFPYTSLPLTIQTG